MQKRTVYGYVCVCNHCSIQRVYLCACAQTQYFQRTTFDNAVKTEMKTVKINSTRQAGEITYSFNSPELVMTRRRAGEQQFL